MLLAFEIFIKIKSQHCIDISAHLATGNLNKIYNPLICQRICQITWIYILCYVCFQVNELTIIYYFLEHFCLS